MTTTDLRADCARCAALCCAAFAFERSAAFAIDKPAETPCPHLSGCGACAIHAVRRERGFGGCVSYDCLGAGQRVVQEMFAGRSWIEDAALLAPMLRAFEVTRRIHRRLALLEAARATGLTARQTRDAAQLEALLQARARTGLRPGDERRLAAVERAFDRFLAGLRLSRAGRPRAGAPGSRSPPR